MIVTMKKAVLITIDSRRKDAVLTLRDFGLLHLEELEGRGERLEELRKQRDLIDRALFNLPQIEGKEEKGSASLETSLELARRVNRQIERIRELYEEVEKQRKERDRLLPWGDFDPKELEYLQKHGVNLRLFQLSSDQIKKLPKGVNYFPIKTTKSESYIAFWDSEEKLGDEWKAFPLPETSLSKCETIIQQRNDQIKHIQEELQHLAESRAGLESSLKRLERDIKFENVLTGAHQDERVVYLQGFIPERKGADLKKLAAEKGMGIVLTDPDPEDRVPTLVENPKAISIIQPVFDMLGTIPGYRERDISLFFLFFLSIFFAMIIGDAGYGLIFLIPALLGIRSGKKKQGKAPAAMVLLAVMGFATVVWGAVTGTWFGSKMLAELPPLKALSVPAIASFSKQDSSFVIKYICFILGTVHLTIAHIWNFITEFKNKKPRIRSFAQLGWLSMILGLFYLVLNLVLSAERFPIPTYSMYMIFGGVAAVFIFGEQEGNFFKGVGKGIAGGLPTFLSSISAFSDIISYIRLFAVGLASVEIAKSFNAMASGLGNDVLGIVGGIFILFLGHALNLAMGALSVVVHGVRLNMLEFSGHLGMEWTGVAYDPFNNKEGESK